MGKYFLGWILGVPAIVLVIAYFFFHWTRSSLATRSLSAT